MFMVLKSERMELYVVYHLVSTVSSNFVNGRIRKSTVIVLVAINTLVARSSSIPRSLGVVLN